MLERIPPVRLHCGIPMEISSSRLQCPACGFEIDAPSPEEVEMMNEPRRHCGISMDYKRNLRCSVCGFETSERVELKQRVRARK